MTHWKRPWCWEGLGARGEGDDRGWDGWMASLTWWTWVWVNSGSCWWTGRPGVLRFMGLQRVRHDWVTDLIWYQPHTAKFSSPLIRDFTLLSSPLFLCIQQTPLHTVVVDLRGDKKTQAQTVWSSSKRGQHEGGTPNSAWVIPGSKASQELSQEEE